MAQLARPRRADCTAQLARAGWVAADPATSGGLAATTLDRTDGPDRWRMLLIITEEGAARARFLRLRRAPAP